MGLFSFLFKRKPKKLKLGLALGSGGAKGMVHIGALKAFEENGIEFDIIAGTSIGSIVGAFYSAGYTSSEIMHLLEKIDFKEILNKFMVKMDTTGLERVLNKNIGHLNIEELTKPFACVATDVNTGEEVDMTTGSVAKALCASSAYPPFFKPVEHLGKNLVDGAFTNAIPADLVKNMGADFIVGIDLSAVKNEEKSSILAELFPNNKFGIENPSEKGYKYSDIMLTPDLSAYKPTSIRSLDEMYEIGYQTALSKIAEIKKAIGRK